ncbi:hypothetical protein TSUD_204700 [Trifolium subterraneum]|uniref:Uncharacterized protein n=1 Tax=Trifolium subterraneum TaxID=3900 RepID=A0A2Z6N3J5_TRISU|nr:hypothetical protein TSUD_204700 [Trifolium subterraneum]
MTDRRGTNKQRKAAVLGRNKVRVYENVHKKNEVHNEKALALHICYDEEFYSVVNTMKECYMDKPQAPYIQ